jgi:integrase
MTQSSSYARNRNACEKEQGYTTASHLVEAGVPLAVVKNILGHASIQSTQVYVEITQQTVDRYMQEWNDKWFPRSGIKEELLPKMQSSVPEFLL